jgi:hypothetical protein
LLLRPSPSPRFSLVLYAGRDPAEADLLGLSLRPSLLNSAIVLKCLHGRDSRRAAMQLKIIVG